MKYRKILFKIVGISILFGCTAVFFLSESIDFDKNVQPILQIHNATNNFQTSTSLYSQNKNGKNELKISDGIRERELKQRLQDKVSRGLSVLQNRNYYLQKTNCVHDTCIFTIDSLSNVNDIDDFVDLLKKIEQPESKNDDRISVSLQDFQSNVIGHSVVIRLREIKSSSLGTATSQTGQVTSMISPFGK